MALKEIKSLKKGDKFFASTPTGTAPFAAWAEVVSTEILIIYATIGSSKRREIIEVEFKYVDGKRKGEVHKILLNSTNSINIPDRPNKFVRIMKELLS